MPSEPVNEAPYRLLDGVSFGADVFQNHTFVCDGVRIDDGVFIGNGVTFVNDRRPRVLNDARGHRELR